MECIPYLFFSLLILFLIFWCVIVAIVALILAYFARKKKLTSVLCFILSLIFFYLAYHIYSYDYSSSELEKKESNLSSPESLNS